MKSLRIFFGLFIVAFIVSACSVYSPSMLRASYNNLPVEIAGYIKSTAEFTKPQEAAIDDYANELIVWHRREKLPGYAERFVDLASLIERGVTVPFEKLQEFTGELVAFPHFNEAGEITLKLATIATTLTDDQVAQIRKFADEENDDYRDEILNQSFTAVTDDIVEGVKTLAGLLGVRLNKSQLTNIRNAVALRYDLRQQEVLAEQAWNDELMDLMGRRHDKGFQAEFTRLWNTSDQLLTGVALEQKQQNEELMASVLRDILLSLDEKQKQKLVERLASIGEEMRAMSAESET